MSVTRHTLRLRVQDPVQAIRSGLEREIPPDPRPGETYYATDTRTLWICDVPRKWTGVELGPSVTLI